MFLKLATGSKQLFFSDLSAARSQPERSVWLVGDQVTKGVFREGKVIGEKAVSVLTVVAVSEHCFLGDLLESESQWGALKTQFKWQLIITLFFCWQQRIFFQKL